VRSAVEYQVRVLLADDEPVILDALRQLLEDFGYDVVGTARDGAEALNMAITTKPDVVIADLRMPELTGLELASRLRELLPRLPVIILSAYGDVGLQLAAEKVPVAAYLVKGCSSREIDGALRAAATAC
jgi:YesN/AraC family two-component response regulator